MKRLQVVLIVSMCLVSSAWGCIGERVASVDDVDRALAEAKLSDSDVAKVRHLRGKMAALRAQGEEEGALAAEAEAMVIMGHQLQHMRGGCARWVRKTS